MAVLGEIKGRALYPLLPKASASLVRRRRVDTEGQGIRHIFFQAYRDYVIFRGRTSAGVLPETKSGIMR
eukprot:415034-Amorphochlora_amoeboformis.AAC.1